MQLVMERTDIDVINMPHMIMIGSTGRNSGKTTLAMEMIKRWKSNFKVIGLKVTTVEKKNGKCPRGGEGCGVCSNIKGNFEIVEEVNPVGRKDTSCLLDAGAEKVYWIKTLKDYSYDAICAFKEMVSEDTVIVCESNSLRNIVKPGMFIMIQNTLDSKIKKSAAGVIDKADMVIKYNFIDDMDSILKDILIKEYSDGIFIKNDVKRR